MYVHEFKVTAADGSVVHVQIFAVASATRDLRVQHRVVELPPPSEESGLVPSLGAEDWDDFDFDEG